jgi:hypothetical protein
MNTGNLLIGVGLTIIAGALAGNCMLPMKFLRRWEWENAWFVFTLVSLLVLPWMLAATLVARLPSLNKKPRSTSFGKQRNLTHFDDPSWE